MASTRYIYSSCDRSGAAAKKPLHSQWPGRINIPPAVVARCHRSVKTWSARVNAAASCPRAVWKRCSLRTRASSAEASWTLLIYDDGIGGVFGRPFRSDSLQISEFECHVRVFQAASNSRRNHSASEILFWASKLFKSPNSDRGFRGYCSRSERNTVSACARLGRSASRQHQAIPARDKTIRVAHRS